MGRGGTGDLWAVLNQFSSFEAVAVCGRPVEDAARAIATAVAVAQTGIAALVASGARGRRARRVADLPLLQIAIVARIPE